MRAVSRLPWLGLVLLLPAGGCQTDRDGVTVDLSAALRAYRERADREPGRAEAERIVASLSAEQLNDLGVIYEREGRLENAAWAYQRSVWRDLRFAPAYVNLGNVLRKQGKSDEARLRYRQAMAAEPGNFEAVNNFADLCAQERTDLDEAIALLAPMVKEAGDNRPYGLDTLGWLHHLRGDDRRAAETLAAALREAGPGQIPLRVTVHEHLAAVYTALGRQESAAQHAAEARRIKELTGGPEKPGRNSDPSKRGGETVGDERE